MELRSTDATQHSGTVSPRLGPMCQHTHLEVFCWECSGMATNCANPNMDSSSSLQSPYECFLCLMTSVVASKDLLISWIPRRALVLLLMLRAVWLDVMCFRCFLDAFPISIRSSAAIWTSSVPLVWQIDNKILCLHPGQIAAHTNILMNIWICYYLPGIATSNTWGCANRGHGLVLTVDVASSSSL